MVPLVTELKEKAQWTFVGQVIGHLLSMVNLLLVVRCLGPAIYGNVVYIISFYEIFMILIQFGMGNVLVSFLARDTILLREKNQILTFSLLFSLLCSILFSIIFYWNQDFLANDVLNMSDSGLLIAMLPYFLLDAWMILLLEAVRSQRCIREQVVAQFLLWPSARIIFFVVGYFWVGVVNYWSYLLPMFLAQLLVILYLVCFLIQHGLFSLSLNFSIKFYKKILTVSLAVLLTDAIVVVMRNIDKYMLGYMGSETEVGIYHVALVVGSISSIGLAAVNNIFAPMISVLFFRRDISGLRMVYCKATKWMTIINLFLFGLIIVFANDIMRIAGEDFVAGGTALILVGMGEVVNSVVGSVGNMNVMTDHANYNMYATFMALVFNVIGNWMLIPKYGMNGAAIATAGSLAIHNILNFMFMRSYLPMHPFQKRYFGILLAVVVSSLGAGIYLQFLPKENYIFELMTGSIVYSCIFLYVLFMAGLDVDEKDTMIKAIREFKQHFVKVE